jgi:hypothetical protein
MSRPRTSKPAAISALLLQSRLQGWCSSGMAEVAPTHSGTDRFMMVTNDHIDAGGRRMPR